MRSNVLFGNSSPLFPCEDAQFCSHVPESCSQSLRHVWSVRLLMSHRVREPRFPPFSQPNFRKLLHLASGFQIGLLSGRILVIKIQWKEGELARKVTRAPQRLLKKPLRQMLPQMQTALTKQLPQQPQPNASPRCLSAPSCHHRLQCFYFTYLFP